MGLFENLPFKRGATHFGAPGGAVTPTLDDTAAAQYVGRRYVHEDLAYNTGAWVEVQVCRNDSGISLAPGRLAKVGVTPTAFNLGGSNTAGNLGSGACVGYANVGSAAGSEKAFVIDELLTYNVPPYDLFYIVLKGPTLAYTSSATADFGDSNTIGVGDWLHAATAATSQATTAGRVATASFAGATAVLAAQVANVVGRAMSSAASTQTNTQILMEAGFGLWH